MFRVTGSCRVAKCALMQIHRHVLALDNTLDVCFQSSTAQHHFSWKALKTYFSGLQSTRAT